MSAPVAQGIERRFPKPCVAGSNPAGGANVFAGEGAWVKGRGFSDFWSSFLIADRVGLSIESFRTYLGIR